MTAYSHPKDGFIITLGPVAVAAPFSLCGIRRLVGCWRLDGRGEREILFSVLLLKTGVWRSPGGVRRAASGQIVVLPDEPVIAVYAGQASHPRNGGNLTDAVKCWRLGIKGANKAVGFSLAMLGIKAGCLAGIDIGVE